MKVACIHIAFKEPEHERLFLSLPRAFSDTVMKFMIDKFTQHGLEPTRHGLAVHSNIVNTNFEERYFRIKWTTVADPNGGRAVFGIDMWKEITLDEHLDYLLKEKEHSENTVVSVDLETYKTPLGNGN